MKQIYIITYENAQWCGGQLYCLVLATNEEEAHEKASLFMEETQLELFASEYDDEPLEEGDSAIGYCEVELLSESSHAEYAKDSSQESFYPKVNF